MPVAAMISKLLPTLAVLGATAASEASWASASALWARSFAEYPSSRTRSVQQEHVPGSSPARSPDAPADPTELQRSEGAHARGSEGEKEALRQASGKSSEVYTGHDINEPGQKDELPVTGREPWQWDKPDTPKKGVGEIVSEVASGLADKAKRAVGGVAETAKGHKDDSPEDYKRAAERVQGMEGIPKDERKA